MSITTRAETSSGWLRAVSMATLPPIECPTRITFAAEPSRRSISSATARPCPGRRSGSVQALLPWSGRSNRTEAQALGGERLGDPAPVAATAEQPGQEGEARDGRCRPVRCAGRPSAPPLPAGGVPVAPFLDGRGRADAGLPRPGDHVGRADGHRLAAARDRCSSSSTASAGMVCTIHVAVGLRLEAGEGAGRQRSGHAQVLRGSLGHVCSPIQPRAGRQVGGRSPV